MQAMGLPFSVAFSYLALQAAIQEYLRHQVFHIQNSSRISVREESLVLTFFQV
jgi:hypothetical protein